MAHRILQAGTKVHMPAARFWGDPGLRITLTYALVAGLWILASDWLLELLVSNPGTLTMLATLKGWAFVAVTSFMLYGLVKHEFAERNRAEASLHRMNRELRAISDCNQVLVRAEDEPTLLAETCRIICEEAGYRMAWVGYIDRGEAKTMRSVAWAGMEDGDLTNAELIWAGEVERGQGPAGKAIQRGEAIHVQNIATDPQMGPWREGALQRGFHSCIALPLKGEGGEVFGLLQIYSKETDAFTPDEIKLLEELSGDLAFGITGLRIRTERKRVQESLALRSFMLNNVHEAAYLIDEQSRLQDVNEEACRSLGYSREELLGMRVLDIDHAFTPERWQEHWALVKSQETKTSETLHQAKDGRTFPVEINCNYLEYHGTPYHLTLARDVSERRRIEEEQAKLHEHRQQAQKMEAIGQLAGGVAHDFNNLLSVINGYSEMLLQKRGLSKASRSEVKEILAAGQRAAGLTRQLLAFSRQLVLEPQVLSLNTVIDGFEKMLRRLLGDEFEIQILLDPALELVKADPNQMEQVLLNLCINARDAMPEGGRITLETSNLHVDETMAAQHLSLAPGPYVKLAVSDTGTGMDPEILPHIFEPFFTTKDQGRGTGLGLSTVYGIVEQSGGHITAYSEPGRGSTFCVYLPCDPWLTPSRGSEQRPVENPRGSETILLVEDSAPLCDFFHKFLEGQGYTMLVAKDGEQALEVAEQCQGVIDLLLTDVSMPKLKGPALAKCLLQSRPGLRVLFMSGYAESGATEQDALDGAVFLQKPFSTETLARKIRGLLDGRASA